MSKISLLPAKKKTPAKRKNIAGSKAVATKKQQLSNATPVVLNGLSNHKKPEPINDEKIKVLISKNKFPLAEPVVRTDTKIDGSGMVIAILDTGVYEHNDLKGKIIKKIHYTGGKKYSEDRQGHGTHVAGIIAGSQSKNHKEIKGIAPGAKIISVKITEYLSEETALWKIADGLERIKEHNKTTGKKEKVTAIVICFNAYDNVERYVVTQHHRLAQLIREFYMQDIPVICSSGNNYDTFKKQGIAYPAYISHVVACAATYNVKTDIRFKQYTKFAQRIESFNRVFNNYFLTAPGYQTISCGIESKSSYSTISGSSQAAAVIAGTILLIQQQSYQVNKKLPSVNDIIDLLKNQNRKAKK